MYNFIARVVHEKFSRSQANGLIEPKQVFFRK